jgi:hypothetical protein
MREEYERYKGRRNPASAYSPLLDIGLSNVSPSRLILGYSHPAPASRRAQIVTPPGLSIFYTSTQISPNTSPKFASPLIQTTPRSVASIHKEKTFSDNLSDK